MNHPNCTHPAYIVTFDRVLAAEQMKEIREHLEARIADGEDLRVVVSGIPSANLKVIECSWCRNPDTRECEAA